MLRSQDAEIPIPDTVTESIRATPPSESMTDSNRFAECENIGDDVSISKAAKPELRRSFRIRRKSNR